MRQVVIRSLVTTAALSGLSFAGVGTAAATPADPHRPTGIVDGAVNDAHVADATNILGAMFGSQLSAGLRQPTRPYRGRVADDGANGGAVLEKRGADPRPERASRPGNGHRRQRYCSVTRSGAAGRRSISRRRTSNRL